MKNTPRYWILLTLIAALAHPNGQAMELLVYNNNNNGAGSLRQAVLNNNALGGGHTILFSNIVTGVIGLSGELPLTNNVTIVGPGEKVLRISGFNTNRLMLVSNSVVSISGLTLANGSSFMAGAIYQPSGTLIINGCTIATNNSQTVGAIYSTGTLIISNSTITRNTSTAMFAPASGGIVTLGANSAFLNCTFSYNTGSYSAAIVANGTMRIDSCTIYGNSGGLGGGVSFSSGSLFVTNSTITANVGGFQGPGIYLSGGTAVVRNTIVAGNTLSSGTAGDCSGTFTSGGFNLIGKANNSSGWTALGDQTGTTNSPLNPLLGPLRDNGGPTFTVAPYLNSPAIDQGHSSGLTTDQRGYLRPYDRPEVPNAPGGNAADIGAFEASLATLVVSNLNDNGPGSLRQAISDAIPADNNIIAFSNVAGTISLSSGVLLIDKELTIAGPGASALAISGNFNTRIFMILSGRLNLSGLTLRDAVAGATVASQEQDGYSERGGAIFNQATLNLTDCVITNCKVMGGEGGPTQDGFAGNGGRGSGGAIANIGTLTLTRCTLAGNSARGGPGGVATGAGSAGMGGQAYGGSLYNAETVRITNCTISASHAIAGSGGGGPGGAAGGGIYNELNAILVTSTVASNSAGGSSFDFGGGIHDNGPSFIIRNSTIAGNQSAYGGGLYAANTDVGNTILAANTSTAGSGDGSGTIISSDYNLVMNNSNLTIEGALSHNLIGQNPLLGPLQNNGGPTMTMALGATSPAIDRGKNFGPPTDQRGRVRPYDFPNKTNASGGDASDIGAFEVTPPILSIARLGADVLVSWSTNDAGYTLESKTDLNPGVWSPVPGMPSVVGSQLIVTNAPVGNSFYRLKQ